MEKKEKYFYIILLLIVGTFTILKMYEQNDEKNAELCSVYFNKSCYAYYLKTNICSCDGGDKFLTSEMIEERNELMREMAKQSQEPYTLPNFTLDVKPFEN